MLISFLVGFAIGAAVGAVIDLCIEVYNEWLSSVRAKELVKEKLGKRSVTMLVDSFTKVEYGASDISLRVFDEDDDHIANVTFKACRGSSLYPGQIIK